MIGATLTTFGRGNEMVIGGGENVGFNCGHCGLDPEQHYGNAYGNENDEYACELDQVEPHRKSLAQRIAR